MKKAVIIHGWGANSDSNWFPWLRSELSRRGYNVKVPDMPSTDNPLLNEWLSVLDSLDIDEDTVLIGHSLGVITILKYLENHKAKAAILVSGFLEGLALPEELHNFIQKAVDCESIKKNVKKIIAIHSDNDPLVPLNQGKLLKEKLNAKLIILPGQEHINVFNKRFELPIALKEILSL